MSGPVSHEMFLKPEEIEVSPRLRPVTEAGVQSLIASIREIGTIMDPIQVRALKGRTYRLIAGLHRLEAVRRLGWAAIPARVWSGTGVTDDWCRMVEVDDNLAGAEMDALDTAVFLAERQRLYLKLHPETAQHVAGGLARQGLASDIESFAGATAAKFGISRRHVERLTKAGAAVLGTESVRLQGARKRPKLNDLLALAKADPDLRGAAITAFVNGEVARIADALKGPSSPPKDPVEEAFKALREAWERAPEAARRRFVAEHHAALSARVRDEAERLIVNARLGEAPDSPVADQMRGKFGPRKGRAAT